jgi:hypothetical protein
MKDRSPDQADEQEAGLRRASGTTPRRAGVASRASSLSGLTDGLVAALTSGRRADYPLAIAQDNPKTFCALLTPILPAKPEGTPESGIALGWARDGGE